MDYYPHEFETEVVHHNLGTYRYTVVFLDPELTSVLPFDKHPRLRISGEIVGDIEAEFEGAWQPSSGKWYLMLSKKILRDAGLSVGSTALVRFRVEDQDEVAVPPELSLLLDGSKRLRTAFDNLTVGKQRGLAVHVSTAKTKPTRDKRLADIKLALSDSNYNGPLQRLLGKR